MKTFFLSLIILGFVVTAQSQERWTVQLNGKTMLLAKAEDTTANVVSVNDLKKGSLIVTYVPGKVENERKRRIMIYDVNDRELYSKEAHSISVPVASLKKWKWNSPQLRIYTMPVLGEAGANVRLRRVHLATIHLE